MHKQLKLPKDFHSRLSGNDFLFLREAIRCAAGVGLLSPITAEPRCASGELVGVLPSVRLRAGCLLMLYPATGPVAPKVTAFRDVLIATPNRSAPS